MKRARSHRPLPSAVAELATLPVDARRLLAQWRIPAAALRAARAKLKNAPDYVPLLLRFHDRRSAAAYDVEVQGLSGRHYQDFRQPGGRYRVELGLARPDGRLIVLAQVTDVRLPAEDDAAPQVAADVSLPGSGRDGEWTSLPSDGLLELRAELVFEGHLPPGASLLLAGTELRPDAGGRVIHRRALADGALALALLSSGPTGTPGVPALEWLPDDQRPGAEIHVAIEFTGRLAPGARLRLDGREVAARPDGSFCLRRPLPLGAVLLPWLALRG